LAAKGNDCATTSPLKWFIDEQVKGQKNITQIVEMPSLSGSNIQAVMMLDNRLGARAKRART
jgi:ferritin